MNWRCSFYIYWKPKVPLTSFFCILGGLLSTITSFCQVWSSVYCCGREEEIDRAREKEIGGIYLSELLIWYENLWRENSARCFFQVFGEHINRYFIDQERVLIFFWSGNIFFNCFSYLFSQLELSKSPSQGNLASTKTCERMFLFFSTYKLLSLRNCGKPHYIMLTF